MWWSKNMINYYVLKKAYISKLINIIYTGMYNYGDANSYRFICEREPTKITNSLTHKYFIIVQPDPKNNLCLLGISGLLYYSSAEVLTRNVPLVYTECHICTYLLSSFNPFLPDLLWFIALSPFSHLINGNFCPFLQLIICFPLWSSSGNVGPISWPSPLIPPTFHVPRFLFYWVDLLWSLGE